ncbi:hypothetical protein BHE74_00013760 [Ensete ventricosum]|nr:hypothetical protein BHE74_00013760 [Ensete ventricosum]
MRKLVCVDREEAGKLRRGRLGLLGNTSRLGLLDSAPQAPPSRGSTEGSCTKASSGWGRCNPSDDQISVPSEMVLRVQY